MKQKTKAPKSTFIFDCQSRRKSIAKMRKKFPCYTLQQIGNEFGISRERVRQVLNLMGEETKNLRMITPDQCQRCGEIVAKQRIYCGKCQHELHNVQLVCDQCGKMFWRRVSQVLTYPKRGIYNHHFCDRDCFNQWTRDNKKKLGEK
jgi:ribosomal protein S27AE